MVVVVCVVLHPHQHHSPLTTITPPSPPSLPPHKHCSLTKQGQAIYAPEKEALVWKIKNFPGNKEFLLRCKFSLPSVAAEEEQQGRMPPIRVKFEVPYYTVSGIQVGGWVRVWAWE